LERALLLLKRSSTKLRDPDSRMHYAVALHLSGQETEAKSILKGFAFDESVPGHQLAARLLKQSP
jgi:hypothetical protein